MSLEQKKLINQFISEFGFDPFEQQDAQAVPNGWKLVPVEPTPEMCNPSGDVGVVAEMAARYRREIWESMLNAAPTPPEQQE